MCLKAVGRRVGHAITQSDAQRMAGAAHPADSHGLPGAHPPTRGGSALQDATGSLSPRRCCGPVPAPFPSATVQAGEASEQGRGREADLGVGLGRWGERC